MSGEPLHRRILVPSLIATGALAVTILAWASGAVDGWERFLYDLRLRGNLVEDVDPSILPAPVDDVSTGTLGRWPWARWVTAELAAGLDAAGTRLILLDLSYKDPVPGEDPRFLKAMADAPHVLAAYTSIGEADPKEKIDSAVLGEFERRFVLDLPGADEALPQAPRASRLYLPIAGLVELGPGNIANSTLDKRIEPDGVVRRVPLLWRYVPPAQSPGLAKGHWLASLTLAMACRWYGVEPAKVRVEPGRLVLPVAGRELVIPVDDGGRLEIHWTKARLASKFVSASDLVGELQSRQLRSVKEKAVLVYLACEGCGDIHDTPLNHDVPGGIINAEALNTILTGRFIRRPARWVYYLLFLLEGALVVAAATRWTSYRLAVSMLALVFLVVTLGIFAFEAFSVMVVLLPLVLFAGLGGAATVVWRTLLEDRERIDLVFTLKALQNQALKERERARAAEATVAAGATETLKRSVDYGKLIESLREIDKLENTFIGKHYRLLKLIDEGGMGLVFKARDEALGRIVAIKVLTRHSAKLLRRFQNEAKAIGALSHPNVVQVFAVASEGDIPYIVMEFVDGTSLSQRIRNDGPLPVPVAMDILLQVARGLDAAHLRQIIHRDIKTSNILLTREGTAKLIDFGIAKLTAETGITGEKEVVGTADYMSPEQGRGLPVDHRSDIYSLGITLYRMLTGKLPFKAEDTVAVLLKQVKEPLPDVTRARPDVPPSVVAVLSRMTAKKPEDRYQSCRELCDDVESLLPRIQTWPAQKSLS